MSNKPNTRSQTKLNLEIAPEIVAILKDSDNPTINNTTVIPNDDFNPEFQSTINNPIQNPEESFQENSNVTNPFNKSSMVLRSPTEVSKNLKIPEILSSHPDTKFNEPLIQIQSSQSNFCEKLSGDTTIKPTQLELHSKILPSKIQQDLNLNDIMQGDLDCTLQEANTTAQSPRLPKFVSPAVFDPANSNALNFLNSYERTCIANGWTNNFKIKFLGSFLSGASNVWYNRYLEDAGNFDKTWSEVKKDFTTKFGGDSCVRLAKIKLINRKQQSSENIKNYFYDLVTLAENYNPNMNKDDFVDYFENGLQPKFLQMYCTLRYSGMSVDDLEKIVHRLSDFEERSAVGNLNQLTSLLSIGANNTANTSNPSNFQTLRNRTYVPNTNSFPPKQNNRPFCNRCNVLGHYTSTCWYNQGNQQSSNNSSHNRFNSYNRPSNRPNFQNSGRQNYQNYNYQNRGGTNSNSYGFRNNQSNENPRGQGYGGRGFAQERANFKNVNSNYQNINSQDFRNSGRGRGGISYENRNFFTSRENPNAGGR